MGRIAELLGVRIDEIRRDNRDRFKPGEPGNDSLTVVFLKKLYLLRKEIMGYKEGVSLPDSDVYT